MPTVACPECRRENEIERIYCHDCGARLEKKAVKQTVPKEEDTQKRVKKLFDPQRAKMRALFFKLSKIVLAACASAAITVMALPPELPGPAKPLLQAPTVGFDLERLLARHEATQVIYSDEQANLFLTYDLKSKAKALDLPLLEFKRALVGFREGAASVMTERACFGYSLFTTIDFRPAQNAGKASLKVTGASIGRMPIHPKVAPYINYLFLDLWRALERERKLAARLTSVEFHDKNVHLIWIP
jgi:hypothetical protein